MAALTFTFTNNSSLPASDVHIGFVPGAGAPLDITNTNTGDAVASVYAGIGGKSWAGNWYTLKDLSDGISISHFSGRIYVCYGTAWTPQYQGYEPGQAVTDPNFFLRYDKMEITFNGDPADAANLTTIDYWAIPMSLTSYGSGGKVVQQDSGLKDGATSDQVYKELKALTTPPASGLSGPGGDDGSPLSALVPGDFKQYGSGPKPGTNFARVIGPSSYPSVYPTTGIPVMPYNLMEDYLVYLRDTFGPKTKAGTVVPNLGDGVIAIIKGEFAGVGPNVPASGPQSRQSYQYLATIDDGLNILLSQAEEIVSGATVRYEPVKGGHTMLFKRDDLLNPSGIYGGNAPYYFDGASTPMAPANNVYGWISGDVFSGISIGAVGSETVTAGEMVGAMPSQKWFQLPGSLFFAGMQTKKPYFNQWAATLAPLSDAYNFAYSDRFAHVLVSLNPANVAKLELTLEPTKLTYS
ncbi:beta-1,3-glucanase family protein [Kordiimonas lacus]|uniref:Beta-1,3-glucanase n=1 Tax=Kordiimonas lacus TaxID=637679 RepID=A0A1G7BIV4_9PROT|nr:beta-1,3-glucanase family protein [Kordiimonas lacus]SDE26913.1 Beta-1,3-glucanase [Kordiimonas lacus]